VTSWNHLLANVRDLATAVTTRKRGNCECIATWNRLNHASSFPL